MFRQELANYNWSSLIAAIDNNTDSIDNIYDDFVRIVKWHVNYIVPRRKVSMRERDPSYITPRIKLLLRKRNRLRRSDKNEQADCIAVKINRLIVQNRSTALAGANNKDTKQLWALLRKTGNWGTNKQSLSNIDVNVINDFFANIATDPNYSHADVIQTPLQPPRRPHIFVNP